MGRANRVSSSSSSSVDSTSSYTRTVSSSCVSRNLDLTTDLRMGPCISSSSSFSRPNSRHQHRPTLFVKVYMEGVPIGRKVDLFTIHGYNGLIQTLSLMFRTTLLYQGVNQVHDYEQDYRHHILTYEDKEGDWMMVGDIPWEMFLTTVERLKIKSSDMC